MKILTKLLFFVLIGLFGIIMWREVILPLRSEKSEAVQIQEKTATKLTYEKHLEKGDLRASEGYTTLAIAQYAQASKIEPSRTEPYIKIGDIYLKNNEFEKALENYRIASQLDQKDTESKIKIGAIYLKQGEIEKADSLFNTLTNESPSVFYYRGIANVALLKHDDARYNLQKGIENEEGALPSELEKTARDLLEAYNRFDNSEGGSQSYLLTMLAKSLSLHHEIEVAKSLLLEALNQNGEYRDAWILLGYAQLITDQEFDALSSLKKALEIDPSKPETLFYLGLAYEKNNDNKEAFKAYEKAYSIGYEPASLLLEKLSALSLAQNDYTSAQKYYLKRLQSSDATIDDFVKTIWISLDHLKDTKTARSVAKEAIDRFPDNPLSYNLMGWADTEEGNMDEAKENLDKALELNSHLAAAYYNLGIWYLESNDTETAKQNLLKAYELEPGSDIGRKAQEKYNEIIKTKNLNE